MAKLKLTKETSVDVLILHGMDNELVNDIEDFLKSLDLTASNVLSLSSLGKPQNERVNYQIKSCGMPLVLLTFDEKERNPSKGRPNVYDELARCQSFRPKDTIVLREVKNSKRVEMPSNVEGKLVILEFERTKLHKLFPRIITELKGRKMIKAIQASPFDQKISLGNSLNKFIDQMDKIWEEEFDIASDCIDRYDWYTENKFQVTLDKFFLEYWKVFNALIRERKLNGDLKLICDSALNNSLVYAAEVWEAVADAKIEVVEDLKAKKEKDKKFDNQTYDKLYKIADTEIRDAKKKHSTSLNKIKSYKNAIDNLNTLINKVGI